MQASTVFIVNLTDGFTTGQRHMNSKFLLLVVPAARFLIVGMLFAMVLKLAKRELERKRTCKYDKNESNNKLSMGNDAQLA